MTLDNGLRPALARESGSSGSAERYRLRVQVGILTQDGQTKGSVRDMSISGARIEDSSLLPEEGSTLRLGFAFYAHALPVPIHAKVVRRTETGGFAVEFQDVDFRTQILLRALLPKVSGNDRPNSARVLVSDAGHLEAELSPGLLEACAKHTEAKGISLDEWVVEQLERAAMQPLQD